jgi:phosphodiesterase/alkaline phosphatase D-like protein
VSLACTGLPTKTQSIASKQLVTVETGWTSGCSTVTVSSSNGWDTNFDDFVHDQAGADTTAPTISGVQATGVTSTAATISWTTNEASDTQVEYGTTTAYGSSTTLNPAQVTTHSQGLSGLTPGTIYHYRVKSRDGAGNLATSTDFQFTTAPADTTAPLISAVQATNVTANGATIGWTTNEASDTQVEYGTTTAYGTSTTLNTALVTSHSQGLSGLAPSTLYHYRVKSRDGAGNLATSADFTFTTLAADTTAPVISAVQATNVTANGATIGWTTNEGSDTQVEYGTTTAYGTSTTLIPALVTTHSQGLSGLSANTLYHYRVKSRDAAGNLATSGDFTFTTSAAPATQTVTFNDKAGQDQPLSGEYPTGVINWGPDGWYHSGPWGAFTTKSASFGGPGQTNATFTFVSPRKLVSVRVYNGGGSNTTVTFTCGSQTKSQVVAPGANVVVTTGWANACTSVTFASTNGWDTNFDDIVHGAP